MQLLGEMTALIRLLKPHTKGQRPPVNSSTYDALRMRLPKDDFMVKAHQPQQALTDL